MNTVLLLVTIAGLFSVISILKALAVREDEAERE